MRLCHVEYVVQGHRFNIYGEFGPFPALYNTALLYILNCIWPVILGLISAAYCGKLPFHRPSPTILN